MHTRFHKLAIAVAAALCLVGAYPALAADDAYRAAENKAAELDSTFSGSVRHWRYIVADVKNGQDTSLNDSSWTPIDTDGFTWGTQAVAWFRTKITVPAQIEGVSTAGRRLMFECGCDDDGTLYVDGKKILDFHWGDGKAVLAEKAVPGQTFSIAIRNLNTAYGGALLFARLNYDGMTKYDSKTQDLVRQYLAKYRGAKALCDLSDTDMQAKYRPFLAQSMDLVDMNALKAGKLDVFLTSLKTAEAPLTKTEGLMEGFTCHLVGHAHIDMDWLWLWPETVEVCKNTFSTLSNLMDEYPNFKFGQSQPVTYLAMQEHYPEVFNKIKTEIKKGQWDPIASNWDEGDTNMSSGEAIVRAILYGKRYMKQQFGTEAVVGWEPDTFGHAWTLPQILAKSGIKYYYFTRCGRNMPLFWWQGPDGSRVLAYCFGGYGDKVDEGSIRRDAVDFAKQSGVRDFMRVYGVGDHGGGPTKEMIEQGIKLQSSKEFPKIKFDTATGYFNQMAASGAKFPVWNDELNTTFEGCYTTHSDMKLWNRESENILPCAEKFSVIASGLGADYPAKNFEASWRSTCFNEFHDILCGSAIHGSYIYSKQLHDDAVAQAGQALDKSLDNLVSHIDTKGSKGSSVAIVVFNSLSWNRTDAVNVPSPFSDKNMGSVVVESAGKTYPAQIDGDKLYFTAHDVPALGYKVYWAKAGEAPAGPAVTNNGTVLENQFLRARIDPTAGVISGVYDKANLRDVLPKGGKSALLEMLTEASTDMSAWNVGSIVDRKDLLDGKVRVISSGPAKASIAVEHGYGTSHFTQIVTLYDSVPRVDIHMTADWREVGTKGTPLYPGKRAPMLLPMLKVGFPVNLKSPKATFEIPFGSIERPATAGDPDHNEATIKGERSHLYEVPAQKWIDMSDADYGVSLLNDCKYGFDVKSGEMRMSLLRCSYDPDPTPDQGMHEMNYSLYPHKGDWRAAGTVCRGYEINEPLIARVAGVHSGRLPASCSFVSISAPNLVVTALKGAEDDKSYILRFYETNGKACTAKIKLYLPVHWAVETDLMERPIGKKIAIKGTCLPGSHGWENGEFTVNVKKCEIKTYKLIQ